MKPHLTLLLIFCTLVQVLNAQEKTDPKKWGFHITPTSLVNYYPRFRVGTQYVSGQYGYLLGVSYANFPSLWGETNFRKGFSYIAIRPEIRRFFNSLPEINSGGFYTSDYWGIELALSHLSTDLRANAYEATDGEQYSFDKATRTRRRLALHYKYGAQRLLTDRIWIDFFAGVGLQLRHIQYGNFYNRILRFDNPAYEWLFSFEPKKEGWSVRPSFSFGVRIGLAY